MRNRIRDEDIEGMLHEAFVPSDEKDCDTLAGDCGVIESSIDEGVLLLGQQSNSYYSVPLSVERLRGAIEAIVDEEHRTRHDPLRPDSITRDAWDAMEERERDAIAVSCARPDRIPQVQWSMMDPVERTGAAMVDEVDRILSEDGERGIAENVGFSRNDVLAMARIVSSLSRSDVERLMLRGFAADGVFA